MSATAPDPERWARLRAALEHALELPADERDGFLQQEFAGDERSLREARGLLAEDERGDDLLEPADGAFGGALAGAQAAVAPESLEQRVGPYRLRRRIGAGGMGTVYLAVRADGTFRQRVAVKRLHGGDGPEILSRFQRERQVLANLEHPSIARLIDGGVDAEGSPYLVMEYVEGQRIDTFCDEGRLDLRERIELFRQVCAAVSFAHKNLVVHRDLKPGNILVTAEGEPKLLDFGVAKVLDPEKRADDPEFTLAGRHAFTPAYASPEQVRGRAVTTTSDVYSLGVLLYHLLAGRMPYDFETTSVGEMERLVCEIDADPPSAAVLAERTEAMRGGTPEELAARRSTTPRHLARALRGDLDNIVAMALRKEPARRYDTVEQFADDLRRHLAGLPVRARPDTLAYRSSRFLRRHRVPVTVGVLVFGALAASLVVVRSQYAEAERARAAEHSERELAQARADELERLAADLDEQRRLANERADELERQREVAREHLEDVHSFATKLVFDVHREIHPLAGSERAKEIVLEMGLKHLDKVAEAEEPSAQLLRELAAGYLRLGELQGDPNAPNLGQVDEALETLHKAVAFAERAIEREPDDPSNVYSFAQTLLKVGDVERAKGNWSAGAASHRRGLELARPLEEAEPLRPGFVYVLFLLYERNFVLALEERELPLARRLVEDAARCFEKAVELFPPLESGRANLHISRADLCVAEGDLEGALIERAAALRFLSDLVAAQPHDAIYAGSLNAVRVNYAQELLRAERPNEAREVLAPVLEHFAEAGEPASGFRSDLRDEAIALGAAARIELEAERPVEGLALAERARDIAGRALAAGGNTTANGIDLSASRRVVARALLDLGRLTAARDELVAARDWCVEALSRDGASPRIEPQLALVRADLARVAWRQAQALEVGSGWRGELEAEARAWIAASLSTLETHGDSTSQDAVRLLRALEADMDAR